MKRNRNRKKQKNYYNKEKRNPRTESKGVWDCVSKGDSFFEPDSEHQEEVDGIRPKNLGIVTDFVERLGSSCGDRLIDFVKQKIQAPTGYVFFDLLIPFIIVPLP